MSCDKLAFWPKHYQHLKFLLKAVNTPVELHFSTSAYLNTSVTIFLALYVKILKTSAMPPAELQEPQKLKKSKKSKKLIKIPLIIPGVHSA